MAAARWGANACLSDQLLAEPERWEFYQAVRLWQQASRDLTPVGEGDDPAREALRFRTTVSFAFPIAEIAAFTLDDGQPGRAQMRVNFLGVATPASFGSLPTPYAEDVALADRDRLPALHEFLDLFNHRIIALFYRAWHKHQAAVAAERADSAEPALFDAALRSQLGLAGRAARSQVALTDGLLLGRAGLLRPGQTSCASLVEICRQVFGVAARVEQFVTRWFALDVGDRSRLGRSASRLGADLTLGDQVPLAQSRFRLVLGPLDWDLFAEFLPQGSAHAVLHELVRLAAGPELTYDVQLDLDIAEVPPLCLGAVADTAAARLGWTTWLGAARGRATAHVVVAAAAATAA
ncbi:MAG: type VI secretion system baseplate subunit TssG [Candidatus Krumholzibacteria bacterium]|nr:type VI secretion system baseplate subunit TssG [Candidatus Krumholzibacteria bacterium]